MTEQEFKSGVLEDGTRLMQPVTTSRQYVADALRTLSPSFHADKVAMAQLKGRINGAIDALNKLDAVKKSLFYGRDNNLIAEGQRDAGGVVEAFGSSPTNAANIMHAIIGIATEAGELLEALRDAYNNGTVDAVNLNEEQGDGFWYHAILFQETGGTFEGAMATNIAKLKARFPDKFNAERANVRNLETERAILEDQRREEAAAIEGDSDNPLRVAAANAHLHKPLLVEAEEASGKAAVERAAEKSAQAFRNVENIAFPETSLTTSDLDGELAKSPAERSHPLPQESMAQNNAGTFDRKKD